ncbi:MAG: tRNA (adenosine(37)-N6)-threonylcarbamoyltransferase complex dimerization subunit type 1 TsaB [Gallionella sp.]|nr:tRNA (adenosine(37)-N6)-threonylcarbamoyltransferase complex dimerization subunit type 1 TsaB [Gallionella sp.]
MKILALETSTEYCSVALWQDGEVVEHCELVGQKHSELLISMIDALLRETSVAINQLEGIAYGSGPGSFTGVRIACGATQGLALGANLPVAGICTLLALAEAAGHPRVIAALDARMGEIYCAAYQRSGEDWITVYEPGLCKPEDAPSVQGRDWFGAGSGFAAHVDALQQRYAGQLSGVNGAAVPQAAAIAVLGAAQFALGGGVDAAKAQPLYLRDKVALKTAEREQIALEKSLLNGKPQTVNGKLE